jgi:hypothetical protein
MSTLSALPDTAPMPVAALQMRMLRDDGGRTTLWFMAIAADDNTQPCRQLSDCPRAVQRANSMFEEYATMGEGLDLALRRRLFLSLPPMQHKPPRRHMLLRPHHAVMFLHVIVVARDDQSSVLFGSSRCPVRLCCCSRQSLAGFRWVARSLSAPFAPLQCKWPFCQLRSTRRACFRFYCILGKGRPG